MKSKKNVKPVTKFKKKVKLNLKWFTFDQNNSGGEFTINDKICKHVIVQAQNDDEANSLAERIGIYFDGVSEGIDCPCCGDRWTKVRDDDGMNKPTVYNQIIDVKKPQYNNLYMSNPVHVKIYPYGSIK